MEFRLDEGQLELQATVARVCADRFPLDSIAAREGQTVDRSSWRALADLGVFGLLEPADRGGAGLGRLDAAIVFEQLGSHLVPGPVLWSVVAAPLVEGVTAGDVLVGGVEASAITDGTALVEHGAEVDVLLVVDDRSVRRLSTASLPAAAPLEPLDPLTGVTRRSGLDGGDRVGGAEEALALRRAATVLTAAVLVGIASRALEVARSYALEREQFGVAIGSFQAMKHLLADMLVRGSIAQSATYAAAGVVDEPGRDDPDRAVAAAKLLAAEAAIENASTAIQVLGGMGFTWDMLPHHLLKRAWVLEQSFGVADEHALHLGRTLAVPA